MAIQKKNNNCFFEPRRVLLFRPNFKMCGIFDSLRSAYGALIGDGRSKTGSMNLKVAIDGRQFMYKGFYARFEHPDVEITFEDLGSLTVQEYDTLCGDNDRVYVPRKYVRSGVDCPKFYRGKRKLNFNNKKIEDLLNKEKKQRKENESKNQNTK